MKIIKVIVVVLCVIFAIGLGKSFIKKEAVEDQVSPEWKTYENAYLSFRYPPSYSVNETNNLVTISSPKYRCRVKGSADNFSEISETKIDVVWHKGKNFEKTWQDVFGFEFTKDNYDGEEVIGDKKAYYFFQGAEMAIARTAYLTEVKSKESVEAEIYTPNYSFECEGEIKEIIGDRGETARQILSTFKFLR